MADLEALSAPNRSIWQPISYMNPIDTYVGNKGKLAALKATDLEFQKADEKLAIDDALQNSAKSLEHDNPAMQQYLAQHRSRIDNIAETIKDPYELNRQIKKASTQFANELADPNSFLGSSGIGLKNYYENLKEAKTPDEKLLIEDNKANYQGVKLDPNTKSYQESILKKREFAPNIDPLDEQNKGVQLYKEDAYKNGSTTFSPDKSFLVHTEKGNRYISKPEALDYFQKTLNTNSDLQLKLKQQAEINTIKELGLGARTKNPDEFKQVYDNNRNKLYSDWINSSVDKLAHDDKSNNETWKENDFAKIEATKKALENPAANIEDTETKSGTVILNNNFKVGVDNRATKAVVGSSVMKDNNGKIVTPNEIEQKLRTLKTTDGKPFSERYIQDYMMFLRGHEKSDFLLNSTEGVSNTKIVYDKLGFKNSTINQQDINNLNSEDRKINLQLIKSNPSLNDTFINATQIVKDKMKLQTPEQNKAMFGVSNEQEYLNTPDIKKKDIIYNTISSLPAYKTFFENLKNYRKDFVENNKKYSTTQTIDDLGDVIYNNIPKEMNGQEYEVYDDEGGVIGNSATTPSNIQDISKDKIVKYQRTGYNLTHDKYSGGISYNMIVSDDKDGTNTKNYKIVAKPLDKTFEHTDLLRTINSTARDGNLDDKYVISLAGKTQILTPEQFNEAKQKGIIDNYKVIKSNVENSSGKPNIYNEIEEYNNGNLVSKKSLKKFNDTEFAKIKPILGTLNQGDTREKDDVERKNQTFKTQAILEAAFGKNASSQVGLTK